MRNVPSFTVAQWLWCWSRTSEVVGSNPTVGEFLCTCRVFLFLRTVTIELDGFGRGWYRTSFLYGQCVRHREASGEFERAVLYLLFSLRVGPGMTESIARVWFSWNIWSWFVYGYASGKVRLIYFIRNPVNRPDASDSPSCGSPGHGSTCIRTSG